MGTPASLLELIATGGSRRLALNAELTQRAAQAKQAEAAARHADAETEKANIEAEAMRQAQADQQVISDAFAHVGGNPQLMDKYIKANASGAGVQRWQMDNQKIREQMAKASAADLDRAEKVHRVMGSSLGYLNEVPDDQLQAEYAKIAPQVQQLDPSVQLPQQIDRMGLKRLMGQLTYADEVLKTEKERAALKQTEQATANAAQEAALKERGAFLQAIRPDMSAEEYGAVRASFPTAAKSFPAAPGQWMRSAAQEAVKVGDRAKVEQDARVLAGMSPTGITAEQDARLKQQQKEAAQRAQQHRESLNVTMRGQNMANDRAKEANDNRPLTEAENKAYGFFKRMDNGEKVISSMEAEMAAKGMGAQAYQKLAPDFMQTEGNQSFDVGRRLWTEAYLRRDSGAAISPKEYEDVAKAYFPQPGNTPAVLRQKAEARRVAMEALSKEAGRAIRKFDAPGSPSAVDPNLEQLQKQFPGATITRVP
jgi:hypothetical protein